MLKARLFFEITGEITGEIIGEITIIKQHNK
jgi:hypothetical protein